MANNPVRPFRSSDHFRAFGKNAIAYMRKVEPELSEVLPAHLDVSDDGELWALFSADGEAIAVAAEKTSLMSSAEDRNLLTVPLQ